MNQSRVIKIADNRYYLGCSCGNPSCCLMVWHDPEDHEVSINAQLNHYLPWYKRLGHGLRYIFGLTPVRCHYVEILMDASDISSLGDELERAAVNAAKVKPIVWEGRT